MNARDQSYYMSLCLKHGISIYPIVYARGKYKLAIKREGKAPKIGTEVFPLEPEFDKENKGKKIKLGVYEKIHELYKIMALRIKDNIGK
ncbi:hypothetical protein U6A24_12710 [Aquimarina gracilis]|uniref:Uncharacterized protein n=1 Tax=Aquimarina gracilis TaxID=874422 RepID=A0ABU5ZWS7_9FLAO|nr:hypothetical protein [Aquimarina gracilis]MEB3346331.1 hypothetical protein [Aquimarina gracilis]